MVFRELVLCQEKEKSLRIFSYVEIRFGTCRFYPRKFHPEFLSYSMVLTLSDFIRTLKKRWVPGFGSFSQTKPLYSLKSGLNPSSYCLWKLHREFFDSYAWFSRNPPDLSDFIIFAKISEKQYVWSQADIAASPGAFPWSASALGSLPTVSEL